MDGFTEDEDEDEGEFTEPEEGDITTHDHRKFHQDGKLVCELSEKDNGKYDLYIKATKNRLGITVRDLPTVEAAITHYMEVDKFWPNCWFISDHGNAHLMSLKEEKK